MAASQTFRSLRTRNARRFFAGLLVSNVGTWIQSTAMSLLVYDLTGKATDVGITLLAQFLPMLLLGVWAGALADRVDKRRMAMITQSVMGVQAVVLGVLEIAGLAELWVVYLAALVLGVAGALDNPARRGFVVELVEPDDIPNVLALNTAVMTGSRIFGPAIAAALIDPLGAGWLFVVNGVTFLAILWPLATADVTDLHPSPPAARGGRPVREAIAFVARNRRLAVLFVVFTIVGTFAFNYGVSLLVLGMALTWRARAALIKGLTMGAFGVFMLGRAAWSAVRPTARTRMTKVRRPARPTARRVPPTARRAVARRRPAPSR